MTTFSYLILNISSKMIYKRKDRKLASKQDSLTLCLSIQLLRDIFHGLLNITRIRKPLKNDIYNKHLFPQ